MTIKTTGAEFKRFYNDDGAAWPEGAWHEDEEVQVGGESWDGAFEDIPDEAIVSLCGGVVYGVSNGADPSFETHFKRWRKAQNKVTLVVECANAVRDAVISAVKAAGGRVV